MVSGMIIRKFKHRDLEGIVAIDKVSFPNPLSEVVFLFLASVAHFFVCELEGKVAGYVVWGFENMDINAYYRLGVDPNFRNKGMIGFRLMKKFTPQRCSLVAREDNTSAIKMYERIGFNIKKRFVKDGRSLVFMVNY